MVECSIFNQLSQRGHPAQNLTPRTRLLILGSSQGQKDMWTGHASFTVTLFLTYPSPPEGLCLDQSDHFPQKMHLKNVGIPDAFT